MLKYAKIIDKEKGLCDIGLGTDEEYYKSIGMEVMDIEQSDVDGNYYLVDKCPHLTDDQKSAQKRIELDSLSLTPADVERALYKAKGMDFDDLKTLIAENLPDIDLKALSIELRAKDFYRGAEINGVRLFDTVGQLLGYSSDDMDYLFENKTLPDMV